MNALFTTVVAGLIFLGSGSLMASEKLDSPVTYRLDVPDPGWSVEIIGLYHQEDHLLVVGQATHKGGLAAAVISKAEATVKTDAANARLPRRFYLLGRGWNWGEGYTSVTKGELEVLIKGAKKVPFEPVGKTPDAQDFVGLVLAEAQALAEKHAIPHRVVMVDGKSRPVTRDLRPDRINFTVVEGKVTAATKG